MKIKIIFAAQLQEGPEAKIFIGLIIKNFWRKIIFPISGGMS